MVYPLILPLMLFSSFARADSEQALLDHAEKMSREEITRYEQNCRQEIDPIGDYALLTQTREIFKLLGRVYSGQESLTNPNESVVSTNLPSAQSETPSTPLSIQGRENPIRRDGFKKMLLQVIVEEKTQRGIEPVYGNPHRWSDSILERHGKDSQILGFSKPLVALASGLTPFYMKTGREPQLLEWMLAQLRQSITFPELFRASYRLNQGDVYLTLLTMENVLCRHWRHPQRENLEQTRRLTPLTSGYEYEQDRFGTWYHFVGMMLYGYLTDDSDAWWVATIEALGSKLLSPGVDKTQKHWMNRMGGRVGFDLKQSVLKRNDLKHVSDPAHLRRESYLDLTEDFRDRIPVRANPSIGVYLEDTRITITNLSKTLKNCRMHLIYDTGSGLNSSRSESFERIDLRNGKNYFQITPNAKVWGVRGFLDDCDGANSSQVFEHFQTPAQAGE